MQSHIQRPRLVPLSSSTLPFFSALHCDENVRDRTPVDRTREQKADSISLPFVLPSPHILSAALSQRSEEREREREREKQKCTHKIETQWCHVPLGRNHHLTIIITIIHVPIRSDLTWFRCVAFRPSSLSMPTGWYTSSTTTTKNNNARGAHRGMSCAALHV